MSNKVDEFCSIVGTTPAKARPYLSISDDNIEQAIQLWFEYGGVDIEVPNAPEDGLASTSRGATGLDPIPVGDDDEDEDLRQVLDATRPQEGTTETDNTTSSGSSKPQPLANIEQDEALARRLQEEFYSDVGSGYDSSNGVRAPIARTTETLIGPDEEYISPPSRVTRTSRAGIFNQRNPQIWDDTSRSSSRMLAEASGTSEASSKSRSLAEMYRPPFEIITHARFEEARDEAKDDKKWLLVNIQDSSIFDCQVLNRDIWKDAEVKATIRENFIFLQYDRLGVDGQTYVRLYFPHALDVPPTSSLNPFPIIAIVDPRTGEQVKVWNETPKKAMDFVMQLHEFLERYSLDSAAKNPVQRQAKPKLDVSHMSEQEMLDLALRNSLANGEVVEGSHDPDELTRAEDSKAGKEDLEEEEDLMDFGEDEPTMSNTVGRTPFQTIPNDRSHSEPPPSAPNTTRIQFRLPDGSRVVRRFTLNDRVSRIYEYIKADLLPELAKKKGEEVTPSTSDKEFQLVTLGKNLIDALDSTIEEEGLKMGTVMVEFVED